jgi:hypothetical protein
MIKLSGDTFINKPWNFRDNKREPGENICKLLDAEKACLVIDAINGSVPACMKKYSVFHNVGIIDPADKGILSWGEVVGEDGCVESKKAVAAKKKKEKRQKAVIKASKNKETRLAKARATRKKTVNIARQNALAQRRGLNLKRGAEKNARAQRAAARIRNNKPGTAVNVNSTRRTPMNVNSTRRTPVNSVSMENFRLFLNNTPYTIEATKGLLNKITKNQNSFNNTQKGIVRNVLNKILRSSNLPENMERSARIIKARMFSNNGRQLRSQQPK